jgi:hypothetical protein
MLCLPVSKEILLASEVFGAFCFSTLVTLGRRMVDDAGRDDSGHAAIWEVR